MSLFMNTLRELLVLIALTQIFVFLQGTATVHVLLFLPNIHLRIIDVPYYGLEARFCMITKEIGNVTTTKLDYIV